MMLQYYIKNTVPCMKHQCRSTLIYQFSNAIYITGKFLKGLILKILKTVKHFRKCFFEIILTDVLENLTFRKFPYKTVW